MAGARDFSRYEAVLPFKAARTLIPPATRWRSTWVVASLQTLKERGHYARYEQLLAREHRDAVLLSVAGVWLPMAVAVAHYTACDELGLPGAEVLAMGARASERAQGAVLDTAARLARGAGVSPWTIFPHMQRLWERGADGGAAAAYKVGPKEAVVHTVGCALFDVPYFRLAFAGVVLGVVRLFCEQAYVHDVTGAAPSHECALRFQWV
jgi:hypothetical protein